MQAIPVIAAVAGATTTAIGTAKANRRAASRQSEFHGRMQAAEQYGIHPLQAIGASGTQTGTGGLQVSQMFGDAVQKGINQRYAKHEQRRQERRQDQSAEDARTHEMDLKNLEIAAMDHRLRMQLNAQKTSPPEAGSIEDYVRRSFSGSIPEGYERSRTKQMVDYGWSKYKDLIRLFGDGYNPENDPSHLPQRRR